MSNIFESIFLLLGSFIGAGFISGKEVYLYFFEYGIGGIFNLFFVCLYIEIILNKTIKIAQKNKVNNYDFFINKVIKNTYLKNLFKKTINIFLVFSFGIMTTGMCRYISEILHINKYIILLILLFFLAIILNKKIDFICKLNKIFIPIIGIFLIFFSVQNYNFFSIIKIKNYEFFSSFLYANFNLLCLIPVAILISNRVKNKSEINAICILNSCIIFLFGLIILFILGKGNGTLWNRDFPVIEIIKIYSEKYTNFYNFIIIGAILTTAILLGYSYIGKRNNYISRFFVLALISFISSNFSFTELIELLYPVFGCCGLLLSIQIIKAK